MKEFALKIVFCCLILIAQTFANEAYASKENDILDKIQKHHSAQEYSLVFKEINRYFSQKDTSLIDKDTVTSLTKWLKSSFIQDEQINPLYGHMLSEMLAALYERNKNTEDPRFQGFLMSAVSQFYVSTIVNAGDVQRCADKTSGQNYLLLFNMKAKKYKEYYETLPRELQALVLRSIEVSRQYEAKRKKNAGICKTGIAYMNKVLSSDNYKSTEQNSPEHLGGKVQIISSELEPEFVSDETWKDRLEALHKKLAQNLTEAGSSHDTSQPKIKLPTEGGDIQIPDLPGFMEVSKHFPNLREFQGLSTTGGDERFFIYIPLDIVAHYILSRNMNVFDDAKIILASATVHKHRNVTDYKFKYLKKKAKEKFSAMLDKAYKKSGEEFFEELNDKLENKAQIQASRSITKTTQLSGIIEEEYYLQMTGRTGMETNVRRERDSVNINTAMVTETALFPINGHLVNMFIVGQNLTPEDITEMRKDLKKWSDDMILVNAQYPKTKETSMAAGLVFFLVILSLGFFLGRGSKKDSPKEKKEEIIDSQVSGMDTLRQQVEHNNAGASYIDLVEDKENKEDFLSQFAGYQNNSLKALLKVILFIQCTAYWAMIGFLYNGLESVSYMMIFLFFASCLNILAVLRKDTIAQAWVPYLNGFGVLSNLICFIYFYIMTAASFNMTKGDAALIWIALGSLFVYLMPYAVPRERVSFFINILKNNLEASPDQWAEVKNELRSKKEFKALRTKLFNYKIEEPDKLQEYTEQVERSFRNNHGKSKQWVVEYLPRNSDTIALFSICNVSPTKATSLILADLENRRQV